MQDQDKNPEEVKKEREAHFKQIRQGEEKYRAHRNQESATGGSGLQPMGENLSRVTGPRGGRSSQEMSPVPSRQETRVEECVCQTCGQKFQGEVTVYKFLQPPREFRSSECPACRELREAEERLSQEKELEESRSALRIRWLKTCGIPVIFQNKTWSDLDPAYNPKQAKLCRQWAENFKHELPSVSPSLLLYSPGPGVGKTLLCSLIGLHIINSWKGDPHYAFCPIKFESGPDLVMRIRATFNLPEGASHEREEDVYRELRGVKVLILDDVGKEQPRSYRFTQELYWYVIDERVKAGLPVVLNSRIPLTGKGSLEEVMGSDTVDRLYGMCRGKVIELKGESYRQLKRTP